MFAEIRQLITKVFGRDVVAFVEKVPRMQQKEVDAFLKADFLSGNFNSGGPLNEDSIPSDAFGEW